MSSRSPNEAALPLPDRVLVARIRRPHGIRGELLVEVLSDAPGRLAPGSELWLAPAAGAGRLVRVATHRRHTRGALVRLDGIEDRETAAELRGALLEAQRHTVSPPPVGSYYYFELAGCRCHDSRHGELGQVSDVLEDGGGLILELSAGGRRLLVPFVGEYVKAVDVAARSIELELPAGLVETCTSAS